MSSGIVKSPGYTMELLYQTVRKLRTEFHFQAVYSSESHTGSAAGADREGGVFRGQNEYKS